MQCVSGSELTGTAVGSFIDHGGVERGDMETSGGVTVNFELTYTGRLEFYNQAGTVSPGGVYTCQMFDEEGSLEDFHIGVYPSGFSSECYSHSTTAPTCPMHLPAVSLCNDLL